MPIGAHQNGEGQGVRLGGHFDPYDLSGDTSLAPDSMNPGGEGRDPGARLGGHFDPYDLSGDANSALDSTGPDGDGPGSGARLGGHYDPYNADNSIYDGADGDEDPVDDGDPFGG